MTTSALVFMVFVQAGITVMTAYFFIRVLRTPPESEPDSYPENDDSPADPRHD